MSMSTRSETAVLRSLQHLREVQSDLLFLEVHQTETAESRSIDDEATA